MEHPTKEPYCPSPGGRGAGFLRVTEAEMLMLGS